MGKVLLYGTVLWDVKIMQLQPISSYLARVPQHVEDSWWFQMSGAGQRVLGLLHTKPGLKPLLIFCILDHTWCMRQGRRQLNPGARMAFQPRAGSQPSATVCHSVPPCATWHCHMALPQCAPWQCHRVPPCAIVCHMAVPHCGATVCPMALPPCAPWQCPTAVPSPSAPVAGAARTPCWACRNRCCWLFQLHEQTDLPEPAAPSEENGEKYLERGGQGQATAFNSALQPAQHQLWNGWDGVSPFHSHSALVISDRAGKMD